MREWLGDTSVSSFCRTHLGSAPFARPGGAASAVPLLDWDAIGRVLGGEPPRPDVLVVADARLVEVPAPRSLPGLRALLARKWGVVVRRAERCDAGLAQLARAFESDLDGEVQLQLFVAPADTHGFGWHFDAEHVFIAQTAGVKDYYFRANTVSPPREAKPDFTRFRSERSPLATARLIAGDWLYIPARWWHVARCVEDSLSISVGVRPRQTAGASVF
jgi:hypothetical protein